MSSGYSSKILWRVMEMQDALNRAKELEWVKKEQALLEKLAEVQGKVEALERAQHVAANKSFEALANMHELSARKLHFELRHAHAVFRNRLGFDDAGVARLATAVDEFKEYWGPGNE